MREIKFRVWIKSLKKYIYDVGFCFEFQQIRLWYWEIDKLSSKCMNGEVTTLANQVFSKNDVILEQYTGFKDKNKKDIYEGDLFFDKTDNFYLNVIFDINRSLYCFERWENNEWCGFPSDELVMFFLPNMKIIGNIRENSELLEEKNETD